MASFVGVPCINRTAGHVPKIKIPELQNYKNLESHCSVPHSAVGSLREKLIALRYSKNFLVFVEKQKLYLPGRNSTTLIPILKHINQSTFRDFKLSRWFEWLIIVSGLLPSILCLLANFSEQPVGSIFWVCVPKRRPTNTTRWIRAKMLQFISPRL
jgi:hypothetical protein